MTIVRDVECNKCGGIYQNTDRGVMSVIVDSAYLSICPKCTKEVAASMGYTVENITKMLGRIKQAQTEHNRQAEIKEGVRCNSCKEKFYEGEPRIRENGVSNSPAWHQKCYGEQT